jgi:polyhydroxyalkanoate synthesis regulator phasin
MSESEARAEVVDELASQGDRDESTINAIIEGEIDAVPDDLASDIADALGVDVEDLGSDIPEDEEMQEALSEIREQVSDNAERIDAMSQQFEEMDDGSNLSDLFDTVSDVTETLETLADAETVDELENRLAALEDEPEDPTSLADVDGAEPTDAEADDDKVRHELSQNAVNKPRVREY